MVPLYHFVFQHALELAFIFTFKFMHTWSAHTLGVGIRMMSEDKKRRLWHPTVSDEFIQHTTSFNEFSSVCCRVYKISQALHLVFPNVAHIFKMNRHSRYISGGVFAVIQQNLSHMRNLWSPLFQLPRKKSMLQKHAWNKNFSDWIS